MSSEKPVTAYPSMDLKPHDQEGGPGLDSKLAPAAIFTQLEFWTDGKPYLQGGGDSDIGRSVAILMAKEGVDITFVYLPEEEEDAQYTKGQIKMAGRRANLLTVDLKEDENCKKAVDSHMKAFGKMNVLVNNSAIKEICEDLRDINLSVVEQTYRTNILSMFALTKYALPHMNRGSSIVNSASVAAYMGNPQLIYYSSTKGAVETFTQALAQQQAKHGIRVNAVAPGIIWTPLQPAMKGAPKEAIKGLGIGEEPLNRPGMPVDVARAYVFLESPYGPYISGEVLHSNGGIEMQG